MRRVVRIYGHKDTSMKLTAPEMKVEAKEEGAKRPIKRKKKKTKKLIAEHRLHSIFISIFMQKGDISLLMILVAFFGL